MAQPTIELPNVPDDWLDNPSSAPASGAVKIPPPSLDGLPPGILGGLPPPPDWNLANSSFNYFVDPETMKTIDFTGNAPPEIPPWLKSDGAVPSSQSQPPQPDGGGLYTGLTPYQQGPDAGSSVLNKHGYIPQPADENQLARIIYAEASNTPSDMPAIGWSVVNRVGDPEFGKTLDGVINKKNAFSSVQGNSKQWTGSADPGSLTGPNATAWQKAQDTAQGILGGAIPDPVEGGTYFFSWPTYNGSAESAPGDYRRMLGEHLIVPVSPPGGGGTNNYFFKRNPS